MALTKIISIGFWCIIVFTTYYYLLIDLFNKKKLKINLCPFDTDIKGY